MLVAVPVASMKTSFSGSNRCCSSLFQRRRALATSARCGSAACTVFFKTDAVPIEKSPDRTHRHRNPTLCQPLADLFQREIRLLIDQRQQKSGVRRQRRAPPAASGCGLSVTSLPNFPPAATAQPMRSPSIPRPPADAPLRAPTNQLLARGSRGSANRLNTPPACRPPTASIGLLSPKPPHLGTATT